MNEKEIRFTEIKLANRYTAQDTEWLLSHCEELREALKDALIYIPKDFDVDYHNGEYEPECLGHIAIKNAQRTLNNARKALGLEGE